VTARCLSNRGGEHCIARWRGLLANVPSYDLSAHRAGSRPGILAPFFVGKQDLPWQGVVRLSLRSAPLITAGAVSGGKPWLARWREFVVMLAAGAILRSR
jgi:hypothetical protein